MENNITVEEFVKLPVEEQRQLLQQWNDAYYNDDNPVVSDEIYDACINIYNQDNPPLEYLGEVSDAFEKYEHPYPVLSLNKINTETEYMDIMKKFSYRVLIQPKVDGLTVVYYPDGKLVSRGDGHIGEILPWAHLIPGLPPPLDKPVRMEVYISKKNFEKYFADSGKNARNMAAGILRRKEYTRDIKRLSYVAYNIMGSDETEQLQRARIGINGFYGIDFLPLTLERQAKEIFSQLEAWSKSFDYETDGIVIKSNEGNLEERYGHTGHHPNGMVAYKFKSAVAKTMLRAIELSYGRDRITPVAVFDPVELGGTTVTRASLHNLNIMRQLNIKIDCPVYVTKKNEIIPQIVKCDNDTHDIVYGEFTCPECGTKLDEKENGELVCSNPACPGKIIDDCVRMSSKEGLDIQGLSEQTWRKILDGKKETIKLLNGQYNPFMMIHEAIYFLEHTDKERHYGLTPKVWTKLCNTISKSATNIPMAKFLVACNVPLLGKTASKIIADFCDGSMDEFWKKRQDFGTLNGIGPEIVASINDNILRISENQQYIISFSASQKLKTAEVSEAVLKIAITGTLSKPRSYYTKAIEEKGWKAVSSISGATNYLLCGANAGSKKEKAEKLGIKIIDEEEFERMIQDG